MVSGDLTERRATIIGAALIAIGSASMSLYTPAMPALVEAFGTPVATIKLTLTFYFAGFTFSQLLVGPLSDAYGRRPAALSFMALYVLASLVAMVAPTVDWLLAARLVQGIGASAGVAIARAIVRDRFDGQRSARIMNAIGLVMAVGPAAAPTVGGLILQFLGWHAIFVAMAIYGVVLIALVFTNMPETLASPDPSRLRPARLVRNYATIASDPRFLRPAITLGCTIGTLYAAATMLPFVLIDRVGISPLAFGLGMLFQSGAYIFGSFVGRLLMKRYFAETLVPIGLAFTTLGGITLALLLRVAEPSFLSVMGSIAALAFGVALVQPSTTVRALSPFPTIAGSAAALLGFTQIGSGLVGSFAAALLKEPVFALATVLPAMTVIALLAHFGLAGPVRRLGEAEAGRPPVRLAPGE
jgi:DHA1 family bicyclomycin/chloramphenicol resistance-like MFS transporter